MDFPIKAIEDLHSKSSSFKWQYFEKLVAFIFEENGFEATTGNILKTPKGKMQIDVIAEKYGKTFLVECKKWKGKSRNLSAAAKRHAERRVEYEKICEHSCIPIIVTLLDDNIQNSNGIDVVPIDKLNWYLNNSDIV